MTQALGSFEVKMAPTTHAPDPALASFALDKVYKGDMEGTAKGEMLSGGDPKSGNAGYVAIEQITGKLAGRTGSFALMQMGSMSTGTAPTTTITIVPGSGTGELSGIYGTMRINVAEGKHTFILDYAFASQ